MPMGIARGWGSVAEGRAGCGEERDDGLPAGDRSALAAAMREHEGALFTLCRRMLGHAEDAEDAVQETFLRALRNLHHFERRAQLRTWLYRIAVNICLDHRRRRRPCATLDESLPWQGGASPESEVVGALRMEQALAELPGRRRAIFLLKEVEALPVAEIAETLECRASHVYYELREAYRTLAHTLGRDGQEEK